jgi:hypothetical protein
MAAARGQTLGRSSFSRAASNPATSSSGAAGVKLGPNGAAFVSSGIPDLDSKQLLAHENLLSPTRKIPLLLFMFPNDMHNLFGEKYYLLLASMSGLVF